MMAEFFQAPGCITPMTALLPVAHTLPTGTVTFLFTDVEGSTRLWEQFPEQMRQALVRHDALIEQCVGRHSGVLVRPRGEGDSRFAVFRRTVDAAAAAAAIQSALYREPWPADAALRVRIAVHTGEADLRDGDYYGSTVNRCARLRNIGRGGQTLLTEAAYNLAWEGLPSGANLRELGEFQLSDIARSERVFQLEVRGIPNDFPPLIPTASLGGHCESVLRAFVDGHLVVFVGEALNLCGRPPGKAWQQGRTDYLPTTDELAVHLARDARYPPGAPQQLTRVAQFISTMDGPGPLYEQLHALFDVDYCPTPFHAFLATLPAALRARGYTPRAPLIVSTSYDDALERAFVAADEPFDLVVYVAEGEHTGRFEQRLPDGKRRLIDKPNKYLGLSFAQRPVILKMYGAVDRTNADHDSFVVTEDNFLDCLTGPDLSSRIPVTVAARLRRSHFLFVGYGLRDWNVRGSFRRLLGEQPLHYKSWSVHSAPVEPYERGLWRDRDIELLDISLEKYLAALRQHVDALPDPGATP
ncbi:MAG TPA: SIR2 family protein [Chloroflexota bacterium]|nr:SIR2 family protein [Chloroflexota bacterium]